mmetsp:Transcript_18838/g.28402  ORF Transcript_18838/g.28402 Transcript_18838/m.28402 type:complete len:100 (-) Transcript_18838:1184-1483(-)
MQVSSVLAPSCASSFVHTCMHIQHKLPTIFGDVVVSVITRTLTKRLCTCQQSNCSGDCSRCAYSLRLHRRKGSHKLPPTFTVVATIYRSSNHSALSTMC